jgi:CheY-like chemotaxis protein
VARVLISEPHEDIGALLRLVVERLGHEVVESEDVDHADVAVIEPAEADGLRLAQSLREREVPFLFTSIYPPAPEDLALAPVAYLVKPFPLYAIERALEYALAS